ncbi:hypothetical protein BH23BAC2_BH23BAC2_26840 [soil metagenome]
MKAAINLLLLILLISTNSCSKQDDCDNPIDCLPPATQTGANTAGCLVNGKLLVPKGERFLTGSVLFNQYVFHNDQYLFSLSITDRTGDLLRTVKFVYRGSMLEINKTYHLEKRSSESSGEYLIEAGLIDAFITTEEITGKFKITHLDETKNIISGTFWFDAINNEGEIVQVREGRFDVRYY